MTNAGRISDLGSLQGMKVRIRSGEIGDSNQSIILYNIRSCGVKYYLMDWSKDHFIQGEGDEHPGSKYGQTGSKASYTFFSIIGISSFCEGTSELKSTPALYLLISHIGTSNSWWERVQILSPRLMEYVRTFSTR